MGPRHSREEILDAAVATAFADGLHRLTDARVAARIRSLEIVADARAALGTAEAA